MLSTGVFVVAEASVSYKLQSHLVDGFIAGILQPQVDHRVLERPAHVELQRQIIHPLGEKEKKKKVCLYTDYIFSETVSKIKYEQIFMFCFG